MKTILGLAAFGYSLFIARTAFLVDGRIHFTLFDDGMISMQYARNLTDGFGLRWNPGEAPVEGFSNLLWTLLMAALHRLGLPDAWAALPPMIVGALVLLACIWLTAHICDTLTGVADSRAGRFAAILTAGSYPLVFWTLRGMEVGLVALFTLLLLRAFIGGRWVAGPKGPALRWSTAMFATAGLTLTRDDALVPVVAIAGTALLLGGREVRRVALACAAVLVATKAAHLGWRFSYYGDLVPNTYYLKLTGVSALDRAWAGLVVWLSVVARQVGPVLVPALVAVAAGGDRRLLIVLAPFAAVSSYSIAVGGDAWEYFNFANRYLSACLPPLCILAGVALTRAPAAVVTGLGVVMIAGGTWDIAEKVSLPYVSPTLYTWGAVMLVCGAIAVAMRRHRFAQGAWATTACLVLVAVAGNGRTYARWLAGNAHAMDNDQLVTRLGVAIRATTDDRASVAAYLAGSTPYFARRQSLDLFGKSDPHVARLEVTGLHPGHNKVDLPYSLGLRPDVVVTFAEAPAETRVQLEERGYVRLCAPLWVRQDSSLVDRERLSRRCVAR